MSVDAEKHVIDLMTKTRANQKQIVFKSQEEIDDICARLTRSGTTEAFAVKITELAVKESQIVKIIVKGVYAQLKDVKTVGLIERA